MMTMIKRKNDHRIYMCALAVFLQNSFPLSPSFQNIRIYAEENKALQIIVIIIKKNARMENKYSSHLLNKLQTYKINFKIKPNESASNTCTAYTHTHTKYLISHALNQIESGFFRFFFLYFVHFMNEHHSLLYAAVWHIAIIRVDMMMISTNDTVEWKKTIWNDIFYTYILASGARIAYGIFLKLRLIFHDLWTTTTAAHRLRSTFIRSYAKDFLFAMWQIFKFINLWIDEKEMKSQRERGEWREWT